MPIGIVACCWPVVGLTRSSEPASRLSLSSYSVVVTHSEPSPKAIASGPALPGSVSVSVWRTFEVAGSIRLRVLSSQFVTQTPLGAMATSDGDPPTVILAVTTGVMASWLNAPHLRAEPVPIRIAIVPAVVAAVIVETWPAVRLLVRAAVPVRVVLIEGSFSRTAPTELQVPLWRTTGWRVEALSLASLRVIAPVPLV